MATTPASLTFGQRLRMVRRARGLSLDDVAKATDNAFRASIVGAYERGDRDISVTRLVALAAVYDVNPGVFFVEVAVKIEAA